ncbi:MAG: GAF domain-containing protein [Anaerolineae bacterium]|nr:GAF domain-containing protein [Anaerolineae bacterium]
MTEMTLEQYKQRVDQLGQALLDVIASVSLGNYDVEIDLPEDIEVLADLATGMQFMVEDLKELANTQAQTRTELESRINQRTRELENAVKELQSSQSQGVREDWKEYINAVQPAIEASDPKLLDPNGSLWLPAMEKASRGKNLVIEQDAEENSLALPIQLHGDVIGVVGFDRDIDSPWSESEINTVEAIIEQVGLALENQRLFDQTQSALSETDLLYQASAELNTAQNFDNILDIMKKFSILGKNSHEMSLSYFDRPWTETQKPEVISVLARWTENPEDAQMQYTFLESPFTEDLLKPNEPTFIQNVATDPRLSTQLREVYTKYLKAKSVAFIPLVVAGRWVGYFNAFYKKTIDFDEDDVRRAVTLATQSAVATQNLRNIQLAEQRAQEAQKRSEELGLINHIVSTVSASFDLQTSLDVVASELLRALTVDEISISLFNEDRTNLVVIAEAFKTVASSSTLGMIIPVHGNSTTQQVLNTLKPVIASRAKPNMLTGALNNLMDTRDYETMVIFPLVAGNQVIGTVSMAILDENVTLSEDEMQLAETIVLQAATSIQNARLFEQTETALNETASLYEASAELNTAQSFQDILGTLHKYSVLGKSAQSVSINVFDTPWVGENQPKTLTPLQTWLSHPDAILDESPISLNTWPSAASLLKADSITTIDNLSTDPRAGTQTKELLQQRYNADQFLIAPLVGAGQWIGCIIAAFKTIPQLSGDDSRRLSALSAQAAVGIQNIRLLEETTRKANQLESAAEIARESSGTLDLDILLTKAINLIRERFGFYHASIFLVEDNHAVIRASTGEAGRQLIESGHKLRVEEGKSIIGHVAYVGSPLVVNDTHQSETHRAHPLLPDTRAELGIPLLIGNRVTGALDVQSTRPNAFSDEDIAVLQILADQLAVAVDNARSFEVAQKAVEEMREVDRLKSQFLANMSHELRTPLNSIIGFSRVILKGIDGPINDLQQQDLQAIYGSGQHLLDMINSILDLSKIEAGKMELSIEDVDLNDLIKTVLATASGLLKEKPIKLVNKLPESLPTVNADRTRVRQVLLNLLQNAAKFTDEGEIIVSAEERLDENNIPEFVISVTDSGIGIAEEDQDKLFEPFSQVDDSPTRKTGGSGLGLSISRRLVEMQGGKIWLDSTVGQGSTFYFSIPIAGKSSPQVVELEPIKGEKIIMSIDDDPKVIGLYNRYLEPHGFQVVPVTDSTQAIAQITELKPLAITLDIMMPKQDGWQIIQEIKSNPGTKHIPVIICSILDNREKGFDLGATDYLVKPILEDDLVTSILRLNLDKSKQIHEILLVDDDREALRLIKKVLSNQGNYRITFADGGINGLNSIEHNPPDAVIMDLFMPDLDGFTLLETIRTNPKMKDIPVIILTGADLDEYQQQRLDKYEQQLLKKSLLDEDTLMGCIENVLQTAKAQAK